MILQLVVCLSHFSKRNVERKFGVLIDPSSEKHSKSIKISKNQ